MDVVLRTSDPLLRDLLQLLDSLPCAPEARKPSNWVLDGLDALVATAICYPRSICFRYRVLWSHSAVCTLGWGVMISHRQRVSSFLLEALDIGFTERGLTLAGERSDPRLGPESVAHHRCLWEAKCPVALYSIESFCIVSGRRYFSGTSC